MIVATWLALAGNLRPKQHIPVQLWLCICMGVSSDYSITPATRCCYLEKSPRGFVPEFRDSIGLCIFPAGFRRGCDFDGIQAFPIIVAFALKDCSLMDCSMGSRRSTPCSIHDDTEQWRLFLANAAVVLRPNDIGSQTVCMSSLGGPVSQSNYDSLFIYDL